MITISTLELRGLLGDMVPFASTEPDDSIFGVVRMWWDGHRLLLSAGTWYSLAEISWHPDEEVGDDGQDELISRYGDDGPAFRVRVPLPDVKNLIKVFAVRGKKNQHAPITISAKVASVKDNTYTLTLSRPGGGHRWAPLTVNVEAHGPSRAGSDDPSEPDIHQMIEEKQDQVAYVHTHSWDPKLLTPFAKVRTHGALKMEYTGEAETVRWAMGHRMRGLIQPLRKRSDADATEGQYEPMEGEDPIDL